MESLDDRLAKPMEIGQRYAAEVDRDGRFPEETIGALADSGLFGLTIAEDAGGLGGGPSEFLTVTRRIASADPSAAMIYLMHTCAAQVAIAGGAPPATIAAMAAAHLSTLAFSERGSRSHFWAPTSQVQGSNGDARLAATKSFVTSAEHADSYVVSTRPADAASPIESSLFLVEASAAGIETTAPWVGLGLRGNASAPMSFETPLSDTVPLGEGGKGLDLMLGVVLPWFQLGQGAVSLGIAEGALGATVTHVIGARLEHLDQTLADLPTVRARIGRARTEVDGVAGFLSDLARRMAAGDATAPVLSAKAVANEMAIRVTSEAMQACGGAAMSPSLPIERFFRDARAGSVMAPTTDVLYELTGRAMAGMPLLG